MIKEIHQKMEFTLKEKDPNLNFRFFKVKNLKF